MASGRESERKLARSQWRLAYESLPEPLKRGYRRARRVVDQSPLSPHHRRHAWLRDVYTPFALGNQRNLLLAISRFHQINRPITGYYFEFGSHEANTMRMAWDAFHHLHDLHYVAFDSFEGLPEIAEIDQQPIWEQGKLKTSEPDFLARCHSHGIPPDRLTTVKGFYDISLDEAARERFLPRKAAVVYIDCDLYASTVPVLKFARHFLQRGTVIVFDDWYCFHGDPDRGEQRAWREFLEREPGLRFKEFVETSEAKSFIFLGEASAAG